MDVYQYLSNTGTTQSEFNLTAVGHASDIQYEYADNAAFAITTYVYDPTSNTTTYTFSGANIAPSATAEVGLAFAGSGNSSEGSDGLAVTQAYWGSDPSANQVPAAALSISATGGQGPDAPWCWRRQ